MERTPHSRKSLPPVELEQVTGGLTVLDGGVLRLATPGVQGVAAPGLLPGQQQVFQVGLQQPVLQQGPIGQTLLGGQLPIAGSGAGGGQAVIAELSRELQTARSDLSAANASASQAAQQAAQLDAQHRYQDQMNQMNQQYMLASVMSMGGLGGLGFGGIGYGGMGYGAAGSYGSYGPANGGVVRSDAARADYVHDGAWQDDPRMGYGYGDYYDPEMDFAMGGPYGGVDPVDGYGPGPFMDRPDVQLARDDDPDGGMPPLLGVG